MVEAALAATEGRPIIGTATCRWNSAARAKFGPHSGPDTEFEPQGRENGSPRGARPGLRVARCEAWKAMWQPGNATHGSWDFMLMMGVGRGRRQGRLRRISLDLFHPPWRPYSQWYPEGASAA